MKIGVAYPDIADTKIKHVGNLNGYGGEVFKLAIKIPQTVDNYDDFLMQMKESEERLVELLF